MGEELEKLIQKPMRDWSQGEMDLFVKGINEINAQGSIVVLPGDRCFHCGGGLIDNVLGVNHLDKQKIGDGKKMGLIIPLCGECNFIISLKSNWQYTQN